MLARLRSRVLGRRRAKLREELAYWRGRQRREGELRGDFEFLYTTHFGLSREAYEGERVLDIGCGPRGSLEWADMATVRVGLDPLADEYRRLGGGTREMTYVRGVAERIPFPDGSFGIVSSFNSLDHVDDLDAAIAEIKRVVRPGGRFLLLVDVGGGGTFTEPQTLGWDVRGRFSPELRLVRERRYARHAGGIYASVLDGRPPDSPDSGVLSAMFVHRGQFSRHNREK